MVDWVQDKHGSCNAAMHCEEIQAKNAVSPPEDWAQQMEKLRDQARKAKAIKDQAVEEAVNAVREEYRQDLAELARRRTNDTDRMKRFQVQISPDNREPFPEQKQNQHRQRSKVTRSKS